MFHLLQNNPSKVEKIDPLFVRLIAVDRCLRYFMSYYLSCRPPLLLQRKDADCDDEAEKEQHRKEAPDSSSRYEPTVNELSAIRQLINERAASARLRLTKDGNGSNVGADHPEQFVGDALLARALGTTDMDFLSGMIGQLCDVAWKRGGEINDKDLNFVLSLVKGVKPKDQIEAMLAAQMAAVHMAAMSYTRRLAAGEYINQLDHVERTLNKLMRTFAFRLRR